MFFLIFSILLFFIIYVISFYKYDKINFYFFDRSHTNYIKGLAIFLVVISHMGGRFGIRYLTPLGGIGVALFLICTGYGISESYKKKGLDGYWGNKISNILFPYFLVESTYTLVTNLAVENKISLSSYIKDITLINTNHPLGWYLQFLFVWYIIFYLVNKPKTFNNKTKMILFISISIGLLLLNNQLWAEQAFSVLFGILISVKKDIINNKVNFSGTLSLLALGILSLIAKQIDVVRFSPTVISNINQLLIKLPLAIALCFLIYQLPKLFNNYMFDFMGKFSFPIYLIHGYSLDILNKTTLISIVLFIIITFVFSILFHNIFKLNIKSKTKTFN